MSYIITYFWTFLCFYFLYMNAWHGGTKPTAQSHASSVQSWAGYRRFGDATEEAQNSKRKVLAPWSSKGTAAWGCNLGSRQAGKTRLAHGFVPASMKWWAILRLNRVVQTGDLSCDHFRQRCKRASSTALVSASVSYLAQHSQCTKKEWSCFEHTLEAENCCWHFRSKSDYPTDAAI